MLLSNSIKDYAWSVARDCDIDSTCVFISDKTTPTTKLHYLGNYGVDQEVLDRYEARRVCDADPFTDLQLCESQDGGEDAAFFVAKHPKVARCGARSEDYWRFVSQEGIEVIGASSLRLQPRLYLTIGAHRGKPRKNRASVPVEQLSERIAILQNKIATNLLSSLLSGGSGYKSLLSLFDDGREQPPANLPQLSARETEIARLVCDGRQNKEIAWITSLSEYTVENHLRRIYQKFGIHNRAALVARMNGVLA